MPVDKGGRNKAVSGNHEASIAVDVAGHGMDQNEVYNPKGAGVNGAYWNGVCDGDTAAYGDRSSEKWGIKRDE